MKRLCAVSVSYCDVMFCPSQVFLCFHVKEQAFILVIPLLIQDLLETPNYSLIHQFRTAFVQLFAVAPAWWNAVSEHPLCFRRVSSRIWVRLSGFSLIYIPSLEWPWMWLSVGRKAQCLHLNGPTLEPPLNSQKGACRAQALMRQQAFSWPDTNCLSPDWKLQPVPATISQNERVWQLMVQLC